VDFESVDVTDVDDEEEMIEGGEITGVNDTGYKVDPLKKHRAATARVLAYGLVAILALSVMAHYGIIVWLLVDEKTDAIDKLNGIYTTWLPVISGLAASAVTYFFTREE
jgi:nitrate reductase NapE component